MLKSLSGKCRGRVDNEGSHKIQSRTAKGKYHASTHLYKINSATQFLQLDKPGGVCLKILRVMCAITRGDKDAFMTDLLWKRCGSCMQLILRNTYKKLKSKVLPYCT
jgi:hypothetical protein